MLAVTGVFVQLMAQFNAIEVLVQFNAMEVDDSLRDYWSKRAHSKYEEASFLYVSHWGGQGCSLS